MLPRLHLRVTQVRHIGKESNRLDETEDGLVTDRDEVYVKYRDEWREWEKARAVLKEVGVPELARMTGMSERTLRSQLNTGRLPHPGPRGPAPDRSDLPARPATSNPMRSVDEPP